MKKIIGSTIAEIIVINVRVSIAAKTEVIELIQAIKIFFVSFILVSCQWSVVSGQFFSYLSEYDLSVEVDDH